MQEISGWMEPTEVIVAMSRLTHQKYITGAMQWPRIIGGPHVRSTDVRFGPVLACNGLGGYAGYTVYKRTVQGTRSLNGYP